MSCDINRFFVTVRHGSRSGCWNTMPSRLVPPKSTSPAVRLVSPSRTFSSVLLPHPLGPTIETNSPRGTERLTSCRASTTRTAPRRDRRVVYRLWTCRSSTAWSTVVPTTSVMLSLRCGGRTAHLRGDACRRLGEQCRLPGTAVDRQQVGGADERERGAARRLAEDRRGDHADPPRVEDGFGHAALADAGYPFPYVHALVGRERPQQPVGRELVGQERQEDQRLRGVQRQLRADAHRDDGAVRLVVLHMG